MENNKKETINVCLQADKNFVKQLAVTLWSLVNNYKGNNRLHIYILSNDISESDKNKINKVCEENPIVEIIWKRPIKDTLDKTKIGRHWSKTALFKLQIPSLLGPNIDKVIYLDIDTVVLGDVAELWAVDIGENILGACGGKSFNSGVMLIDIKKWREEKIEQKCLEFMEKYDPKYEYSDQDALNHVAKDKWGKLAWKWNKSPRGYTNSTRIIHFMTKRKPWTIRGYNVSCRELWYRYLELTPWSGWRISFKEMLCQSIVLTRNAIKYNKIISKILNLLYSPLHTKRNE